jgi:dTMP kinase
VQGSARRPGPRRKRPEANRPLFITFEGIEGCGKSTQARLLARRLRRNGRDCLLTREPGGTTIGRQIRRVLLHPSHRRMAPEVELALYFADRAQHLKEVVLPALAAGRTVVSDRFTDSTLAYQGAGRRLPRRSIEVMDRVMTGRIRPRLTVLLDLPAEESLSRARGRNRSSDRDRREGRFERERLEFHRRVRRAYLRLAMENRRRYVVVEARGTKTKVHDQIWLQVVSKLGAHAGQGG